MAALAGVVAALGLRWIGRNVTDAPLGAELERFVRAAGLVASNRGNTAGIFSEHAPGLRATLAAVWQGNHGQLDARVLALTTLAAQVGGLALLFGWIGRHVRLRWLVFLGGLVLLLPCAPAFAPLRPFPEAARASIFVLFSLLQLRGMAGAAVGSRGWWLGLAAGVFNLTLGSEGLAAAAAITAWCALGRDWGGTFRVNLGLLAVGGALAIARVISGGGFELTAAAALLAWRFPPGAWMVLVWAPALTSLVSQRKRRASLALGGLWAALATAASGGVGDTNAAAAALLGATGMIVNLACFGALPAASARERARNALLLGLWLVPVLDMSVHPAARPEPERDPSAAPSLLARVEVRRALPLSARAPLSLAADTTERAPLSAGFTAGAAPEIEGGDGLPAWGTWRAEGGAAQGEFVSAPLTTTFPWVQIRVAGTLRPPETSLILRTEDGREIAPLETSFDATQRWKRVNFPAPPGAFRVVARDASAGGWIAFTAPVELGSLTRLAGKLAPLWPWLLALGVAAMAGCVVAAPPRVILSVARDFLAPDAIVPWRVVPWIALAGYAVLLAHHLDPTAGPNDSGGYLNSAKLLMHGELTAAPRSVPGEPDPTLYLPITFRVRGDGRLAPEYPVGWPMEVAALARLLPFATAVRALMLLHIVLGAWFTRRLARSAGLEENFAWLAAGIVALSPIFLFESLQPLTDGPALMWAAAAVSWAWTSRERPWHAVLAGLATAMGVLMRPANLLCVVPVFLCLLGPGAWRRLLAWALAGLPGAAWLLWYQHALYGNAFATGYGDPGLIFGFRFVAPTLGSYARWLPELFTPLVVLALAAPFRRTIARSARLVLTSWIGIFAAFYACYWCTWDNWYNMRFLLPAAPAMVVLGLLVAQRLLARLDATRGRAAFAALTVASLGWLGLRCAARDVVYWADNNYGHELAATWTRDHVPADAIVFAKHATGSLFFYTELTFVRSDHERARTPEFMAKMAQTGRPIYALNYHWEIPGYRWESARRGSGQPSLPGRWERVRSFWDDDVSLWRRIGD